jgi:hypothetical protein
MLAGRNDVAPLKYYVSTIDQFSDDGKTFHGAYGYRWRKHFFSSIQGDARYIDQLEEIVTQLKQDSNSRRVVLQMWDCETDLKVTTRDKPCNTHAYFSIRNIDGGEGFMGCEGRSGPPITQYLDMTVCNRSNDLIWGMLGANVVHFSILQEYLAACIGVSVGRYTQFTNNLHVYTEKWNPDEYMKDDTYLSIYSSISPKPLVDQPERFLKEVERMVDCIDGDFEEPFLRDTAQPMFAAFRKHKSRQYLGDGGALAIAERIHADDWLLVARNWINKRYESCKGA